MVRFEQDRYIIEIKTVSNPTESYIGLFEGICDIVAMCPTDHYNSDNFFYVINFVRDLMPEFETVKKMTVN